MGLYFYGILDTAAVKDCTKFPSLITNVCWVRVAISTRGIFRLQNTVKKWLWRLGKPSQDEHSEVQCYSMWTVVIWANTEKPNFYREIDFYSSAWSWNKRKAKTHSLTGTDILNLLQLNVVHMYFVGDLGSIVGMRVLNNRVEMVRTSKPP